MTGRILLLEDDTELGAQVTQHLKNAGFEVVWWRTGRRIEEEDARAVSGVILDLMLPGMPGLEVLRALRAQGSEVPVLVLSARNDSVDKVQALRLGADDYVTKPFWPEELVERARARLRRPLLHKTGVIEAGSLRLDVAARTVERGGAPLDLTRTELDLLVALVRRRGEAVTRKWLVEQALDPERDGNERTLDVHVSRLRKKLGEPCPIETVWGIGYRFRSEP